MELTNVTKAIKSAGLKILFPKRESDIPAEKASILVAIPTNIRHFISRHNCFFLSDSKASLINLIPRYTKIKNTINPNLPQGAEIVSVKQISRREPAVDIKACWAEYRITPYLKSNDNSHYDFKKFRHDVERILSSDKLLITKKNKKGIDKTTDFKKSIGTYKFENDCLFIYLKTGQGSDIPAFRADSLMELVTKDRIFNITRMKFLDENLHEL